MRLVRLSCDCYVNPEDVQELTINNLSGALTVRMRNGVGHHVDRDYNKTVYETMRRIKAELEPVPDPKVFDILEAWAERYPPLKAAFSRATGGIDAPALVLAIDELFAQEIGKLVE